MTKFDERYDRNKIFYPAQQEELSSKKVAVIGCGGLGGYVLEMLARSGVGNIVVCDGDVFCESNLNRQILSTETNLGEFKASVAAARVAKINSEINLKAVCQNLCPENAGEILADCDVAVDGLDSVNGKLMLQRICKELDIPMVHGAIGGWFGQVTTIFPGNDTLSLIYEEGQEVSQEDGNPSFTPAMVGAIQASETLKVLLGSDDVLMRKLLFIDLMNNEFQIVEL